MAFKHILGAAVLAGSLPATALAENFSYNYFETGYQRVGSGFRDDGFYADLSLALNQKFYATASVDYLSDTDSQGTAQLGLGVNGTFDKVVGVYAEAAAIRVDYRVDKESDNSETDTGLRLEAGMRVKLDPAVEASVAFARVRVDETPFYEGNHLKAALRYKISDSLSMGVQYTDMTEASHTQVGLRLEF